MYISIVCFIITTSFCCFILAIFYPFSQFCEIVSFLPSLQKQPRTALNLFQRGVEYGKYVLCTGVRKTYNWMHNTIEFIVPPSKLVIWGARDLDHTCHILPPSEIDLGLCLALFAGLEGKKLFISQNWLKG